MIDLSRDDILERLRKLDAEAAIRFPNAERLNVIIVGGSALILMEYIDRRTYDIDVVDATQVLQEIMEKYDMNCLVEAYINNFPYNYEDRIQLIPIETKLINFYTASLEDIVVAKLYSHRRNDYVDIRRQEVLRHLNWDLLQKLVLNESEAKSSALNERAYHDLLYSYYEYVEEYHKS